MEIINKKNIKIESDKLDKYLAGRNLSIGETLLLLRHTIRWMEGSVTMHMMVKQGLTK